MINSKKTEEYESFFSLYYSRYRNEMIRYATVLLLDLDIAEDVVQSAYMEFWNQIEKIFDCEKPEAWIVKTVKNKALQAKRFRAREGLMSINTMENDLIDGSTQMLIDKIESFDQASYENMQSIIKSVLKKDEIDIFERIIIGGEKASVVAKESNITVATCYKRSQRIRQKIIKRMVCCIS